MVQAHASPNPRSGLPYTDQSCYCKRNKYNVHACYFASGLKSRRNRPDADQWTTEPASQTPGNTGFRTGKAPKISRFSKWTRTWGSSAQLVDTWASNGSKTREKRRTRDENTSNMCERRLFFQIAVTALNK